ncbi:hypothetical protein niasHT_017047 [Heterodera trifolii]|uniref:G-protein coupled receptors family 1 profile domain-containing protein n=1 Tax=Heterodera trifolii TaxID=157864 RepID=A0ABD2KZ17_9BILA
MSSLCAVSLFAPLILAFSLLFGCAIGVSFSTEQWVDQLNNEEQLSNLCTDNLNTQIMSGRESPMLNSMVRHHIMCNSNFSRMLQSKRYEGLVWLMQSMDFCKMRKVVAYHRDFQLDFLRTAYSMICRRNDNIGKYQLSDFAELFRIIFERGSVERREICDRMFKHTMDLYKRCHVPNIGEDEEEQKVLKELLKFCIDDNKKPLAVGAKAFLFRFSHTCEGTHRFTFREFVEANRPLGVGMGQALANDVISYIKRMIKQKSSLPHLVLKTRLLLQHFSLATIWLNPRVEMLYKCKMVQANERFQEEGEPTNNGTDTMPTEEQLQSEAEDEAETQQLRETCNRRPSEKIEVPEGLLAEESVSEFSTLSGWARLGLGLEIALLCGICLNTTVLSVLLHHTRHHLSTVTILFIFNILFSNVLFLASFLCLYSDIALDTKYTRPIANSNEEAEEDSADASTEDEDTTTPQLFIAEILQIHLYKPSEFLKNLIQETLLSLAQNGSLLGLTNLLVLVLVVINRSMSGKGIRISRAKVIAVFAGVWLFLVVSHVLFSALQYFAVSQLHELLELTSSNPSQFACRRSATFMVYNEIGERCDRLAVYQELGHFLLRGHTLFTVVLLSISLVIFVITVYCHRRVQRQHHFLNENATNGKNAGGRSDGGTDSEAGGSTVRRRRDSSPFRRRETLFQTLVLSLIAFFLSLFSQSFIEMYVMVVNDRREIAWWASVYQLSRIAAFIDPLFNPVLVAVRTPIIRRRLRFCVYSLLGSLCALFCPWCRRVSLSLRNRMRHHDSVAITMKTWTERKRSSGSRGASSASYLSADSGKVPDWRSICSRKFFRSIRRAENGGTIANSLA